MSLLAAAFKRDWIDRYFELQKEIYSYFGYTEQWRKYCLSDETDSWWAIVGGSEVHFGPVKPDSVDDFEYAFERGHDFHQQTWIFPGQDYTMLLVHTSEFYEQLGIFDNRKEVSYV